MNRSLFELETGILIFGIAGQLILFFFAGRGLYSAAWWIGIATAAVCAVDMWWALDRGLDLGRQDALCDIGVILRRRNGGRLRNHFDDGADNRSNEREIGSAHV